MTSWNAEQMRAGSSGNAPAFEEYVLSYMGQYIAEATENSIWRGNTATSGEFTGFITGAVIFEGFLKLIDIQDKEGEISYNVNLYSSSVSLKDILDTRKFSDLSEQLKELEHEYNYNNIVNSWEGILDLLSPIENNGTTTWSAAGADGATTTNVLKYPFCDWTGNIDCSGSLPELSVLEDAFRPWIQCKYLLDNIFHYAGFTFQSSIFEGSEFAKLYMDFNWGNESAPAVFNPSVK